MGDVVNIGCITRLDLEADTVIKAAVGKLKHAVIIGETEDGKEYFASSRADGGDVIWYLERAKYKLMKITDDIVNESSSPRTPI